MNAIVNPVMHYLRVEIDNVNAQIQLLIEKRAGFERLLAAASHGVSLVPEPTITPIRKNKDKHLALVG